jgi:ferredoxin-NADP reductase
MLEFVMKLKLVSKINEAKDTKSFIFKPAQKLEFEPGQYIYLTLPELKFPDTRGNVRQFTISSSPDEQNIRITTRMRKESGYKMTLNSLAIGSEVKGEGPHGSFVFTNHKLPSQVFLAGGIGITPFESYLEHTAKSELSHPTYLIYSDSNLEDFTFKNNLDNLALNNSQLKIRYVVTSKEGRINSRLFTSIIENWKLEIRNFAVYVVGPPNMVRGMEAMLTELQIPNEKIHTEKFTGY